MHLFPNDFDRPKATKGEHDSKDNADGLCSRKYDDTTSDPASYMSDIESPACEWCSRQLLIRYAKQTNSEETDS